MGCDKQDPLKSFDELTKAGTVTVEHTEGLEKGDRVVLGRPWAPLAQTPNAFPSGCCHTVWK